MAAISKPKTGSGQTTYRILVVDDDRNLRKIITTNLELAGYETLARSDGAAALATIDQECPDLVLLDVMMPDMDGYEVCRRIRRHRTCAHVPIIMLTARDDTRDTVMGFEAGADDYITKPFSPQEMLARVQAKIRRVTADASTQPLTRLPGNIAIETEIRKRLEEGGLWAVVYVDLDNFKAFNDAYGFVRGDEAIQLLGTTLTAAIASVGAEGDFVGHIGGDDFIVVTEPDRCYAIAERTIAAFERDIRPLYAPADLLRGFIRTHDRKGAVAQFPIMTLSIAVVSNLERNVTSYAQIGEVAAELKRFAKARTGSVIVSDKRKG